MHAAVVAPYMLLRAGAGLFAENDARNYEDDPAKVLPLLFLAIQAMPSVDAVTPQELLDTILPPGKVSIVGLPFTGFLHNGSTVPAGEYNKVSAGASCWCWC